jgi:predicted hydrocarbon binding protein
MGNLGLFKDLIAKKIFSVYNNRLRILDSIDITMYGAKAWTSTLQNLAIKKGINFLYESGYLMGEDAAKEFNSIIKVKKVYLSKKLLQLENIIQICGFGIVRFLKEKKNYKIIVENNQIIEFANETYGKKSLVCDFYRGVYTAFLNIFEGKKIKLKHTECITKKNKKCIFAS